MTTKYVQSEETQPAFVNVTLKQAGVSEHGVL